MICLLKLIKSIKNINSPTTITISNNYYWAHFIFSNFIPIIIILIALGMFLVDKSNGFWTRTTISLIIFILSFLAFMLKTWLFSFIPIFKDKIWINFLIELVISSSISTFGLYLFYDKNKTTAN